MTDAVRRMAHSVLVLCALIGSEVLLISALAMWSWL